MDAGEIERRMREARVPGLALAVVRDGAIERIESHGLVDVAAGRRVTDDTLFEAASLSKPVFAYAVLQLVDAGGLSLDTPLRDVVPDHLADDPGITVRQVLSHTSGLPNWRNPEQGLEAKCYFAPGARFSYSGEGYFYLQAVMKKIAGESLDAFVRRMVFEPLEMTRSGFDLKKLPPEHVAPPYDDNSKKLEKFWRGPNAAGSLHTTAGDYARFLEAVVNGRGLKPQTMHDWLTPMQTLPAPFAAALDPRGEPARDAAVAWGLGWGVETAEPVFFHWGSNLGFKSLAIGSARDGAALVILATGFDAMRLAGPLTAEILPGARPSLRWLEFV
jgi:CubicO group peptidase (beta-lactamase class C family)